MRDKLMKTGFALAKIAAFSAVSGAVLYLTNHPAAFGFETVGVLAALYEAQAAMRSWKDGGSGDKA